MPLYLCRLISTHGHDPNSNLWPLKKDIELVTNINTDQKFYQVYLGAYSVATYKGVYEEQILQFIRVNQSNHCICYKREFIVGNGHH
jgi:hypothetical protein